MYSSNSSTPRSMRAPLEEDPFAVNAPQKSFSSQAISAKTPVVDFKTAYAFGFPSPTSPSGPSFNAWDSTSPSKYTPSLDVEMMDAYATPPTSRILPTVTKLPASRLIVTPRQQTGKPSTLLPTPIQTSNLLCPTAPLTPPLTPPYSSASNDTSFAPSPYLATTSARALHSYSLHPLFAELYSMHEELGCGGFGFVVKGTRNSDNLSVAVKFIERQKIPLHGWARARHWKSTHGLTSAIDETGARLIPMEAYVLSAIHHEGVVSFIDLFEDDKYFYLIMEHHGTPWSKTPALPPPTRPLLSAALSFTTLPTCQMETPTSSPITASATLPSAELSPPRPTPMMRRSSCDLFECIEQHSRFSEDMARYVFAQIVEVVYTLGLMGICHRDIKDENIVISSNLKVKLIDFGSAVIFNPQAPAPVYDRFYGTTAFASAEILQNRKYQAPSSEVWALGVLLSILVTGECPFADSTAAAAGRISPSRIRLGFEVESLMRDCLEVNISKRITIAEIRQHRWLRGALRAS